jgi:hypothetical protein
MSKQSLEIPTGKRTPKYRFFEILPGFLSYLMIALLFIISFFNPMWGAIYLLIIITTTLVKAVGVAFRTVQGYNCVKKAQKIDWHQRLEDLKNPHDSYERLQGSKSREYEFETHVENLRLMSAEKDATVGNSELDQQGLVFPAPDKVYHAVIMTAYNEGMETLEPTVEAVAKTAFPNQRIIFVMAYEERGGAEIAGCAKRLAQQYRGVFYDFVAVEHPKDLKGEIQGKGPNLTYAGKALEAYLEKKHIPAENVIVTSLDSDNRMDEQYLDNVAYEFVVRPNRQHLSYQPVSIFTNNIWDAAAPMRVIAISNSFFNIITTMRPHALRNFASHSQPMQALIGMDFWSKRTIVEDGHQYWRSLFYFEGNYGVVPIRVPIYQDAVLENTLWKTLKAQFVQLRRWDYGASDVAYVGDRLFSRRRKMPFWPLFARFMRLLDGHVTLAAMSPIVAFGGWVPRLVNFYSRDLVTYNLPATVSHIQLFASIGLMITICTSLRMLPPKPKKYRYKNKFIMILQWILMPIVAIVYQSMAAFYSQTRLMLGKYMEKFDVTKKVVKH